MTGERVKPTPVRHNMAIDGDMSTYIHNFGHVDYCCCSILYIVLDLCGPNRHTFTIEKYIILLVERPTCHVWHRFTASEKNGRNGR